MFTTDEIRIANATSRSSGASVRNKDGSLRAVVPKYVESIARKEDKILDYGAGKWAVHTLYLREKGFNCTAYDFGDNVKDIHDQNALERQYDIVYASNVLNVCCNLKMLIETLKEINKVTKENGVAIMNYPSSPRKLVLDVASMEQVIENVFKYKIARVGGTKSAPVWIIRKG
jgi:predicted PolB exonuclease-like 3'-5' exonuclease